MGVVVQVSDRELRYSKFPQIPLFGRAAREKHLEELQAKRDEMRKNTHKSPLMYKNVNVYTNTLVNLLAYI